MEEYRKTRGLTDAYNEWPFIKVKAMDELIAEYLHFNIEQYRTAISNYYKKDLSYDTGESVIKTVDWILSKINS